jgi:hypothetical protein
LSAMKLMRSLTCIGTAVLATACSGGGGGPTGVPAVNVVGHYAVIHRGTLSGFDTVSCPGELDIPSQNGSSFSGTITITATADCQALAGSGAINGTVTSGGTLTFTITISSLEELLEAAGCEILSPGTTFTGTATTTGINASRTISLRCDVDGTLIEADFVYVISGLKT